MQVYEALSDCSPEIAQLSQTYRIVTSLLRLFWTVHSADTFKGAQIFVLTATLAALYCVFLCVRWDGREGESGGELNLHNGVNVS